MVVIYKNSNNNVSVLIHSIELLSRYSLQSIALKDVPCGLPFWIVEDSEIPTDRTFRDAWEIPEEWGEPDGYGSPYSTFKGVLDALDK